MNQCLKLFLSMAAAFDGFAYNAFRKIMCGGMPGLHCYLENMRKITLYPTWKKIQNNT